MLVVEQGSGRGFDSKYKMMFMGAWRPVYALYDQRGTATTLAIRATRAVLYMGEGEGFAATVCSCAELFERDDRDPDQRHWDYID